MSSHHDRERNPVEQQLRRNFAVNVLDGGFFAFAVSFASSVTILPLFVSRLTSSPMAIGLITAIAQIGWFVPQLFTANYVQRYPRKKPWVMLATLGERIPYAILALLALQIGRLSPQTVLVLFFAIYSIAALSGGLTGTAWQDMIAKVIPARARGRFFGAQQALGGLLGSGGAVVAGLILERVAYPGNFAICFGLTVVAMAISYVFLSLTVEPSRPSRRAKASMLHFLKQLPQLLRADPNYARFLVSRAAGMLGRMAAGFLTVYAVEMLGASVADAGRLTAVWMATQMLLNPLLGWWGDRGGHKQVLELSTLFTVASMAIALWAPSVGWFYAVFALSGATLAGAILSGLSIVMEFAPEDDRPTYIGLTNTFLGPFAGLGSLVAGAIVSVAGYQTLFWVSLALSALGFVLLRWTVQEPRQVQWAVISDQ
ncbi:MAG: MFS transporter [Anaerolineae bacterium]